MYESNSHKAQEKKVEKIISGKATKKKQTGFKKLASLFIAGDKQSIGNYIVEDVLVPSVKKTISDIVSNGTDIILYGETKGKKTSAANYISYNRFSKEPEASVARTRTGYSYEEVALDSRDEAQEVISRMDELMETYHQVSVADLYDLVGISCNYTDNKYGWTNIRNAEIIRDRHGRYVIKMPKAAPLN